MQKPPSKEFFNLALASRSWFRCIVRFMKVKESNFMHSDRRVMSYFWGSSTIGLKAYLLIKLEEVKVIYIRLNYLGNYLSVLDIWCGKGGDLQKWQMNRISHYVAVDLSENSVRSASERFKKMKYNGKLPFHSIFIVNNVGDGNNSFLNYIDKRILFDVASCQMSMHYLWESENTARSFLKNVSDRLVPGGYFIGTTLDSNVLVRKLRTIGLSKDKTDKYEFGNQFYSVRFLHKDFPKKKAFVCSLIIFIFNFTLGNQVLVLLRRRSWV